MNTDFTKLPNLKLRTRVFNYAIHGPLSLTQEEIVAPKPEPYQAVYYSNELHMLVFNGGLHYYFHTHGLRTLLDTERALSYVGAHKHLALFREISQIIQGDVPLNGWAEQHLDERWSSTVEELSRTFAMIDPELGDVVSHFIRTHPELYADAFKEK